MKTAIIIVLCLLAGIAYAAATATQVVPGTLNTSGCPGGQSSCWIPISSTNPLPVQLVITP